MLYKTQRRIDQRRKKQRRQSNIKDKDRIERRNGFDRRALVCRRGMRS